MAEGDMMMYEICLLYINVSAPAETLLLQNLSLPPSLGVKKRRHGVVLTDLQSLVDGQ